MAGSFLPTKDIMSRLTWRSLACVGTIAIVTAGFAGTPFGVMGLLLGALSAAGSIFVGIKRHRPRRLGPWYCFAAAATLFFVSYALRLAFPALQALPTEDPTAADVIDGIAFLSLIVGAHRLGQVRDRHKDPTTVIDALILTGGVSAIVWIGVLLPYVQDDGMPTTAKVMGVALSTLTLWLFFVIARLAIGPGARTPAFRPLALAAMLGMVSQVVTPASGGAMGRFPLIFGGLALLCLGVAALHPTMVRVTEPSNQTIGKMSPARLILMTLAVLAAPLILLVKQLTSESGLAFYAGLIVSWMIVTSLVMVRVAGLVRARERVAEAERALRRAAASLVSAKDREETYEAALVAMTEVAGTRKGGLRASMALASEDHWSIVVSRGEGSGYATGLRLDAAVMESMLANDPGHAVQLDDTLTLDAPRFGACYTVVTPLISRGQIRGALLLSTKTAVPSFVVDALESLSSDVSLAIEAMGLAEDLHRRRSEQRFQALVQHSSDVTAVLDQSGLITYISPSALSVLGHSDEELIGKDLSTIIHPEDRRVIDELAMLLVTGQAAPKRAELRVAGTRESWKTLEVVITDLRHEPSIGGIVLNAHDVTGRKALEEDLRHKVLHDDLTGIANRVLFRERVEHALSSSRRFDGVTAVVFLDLDDFKTVNDGLGHDIGDELLKVMAFRLEAFLRDGDTAARLGGDEFAVLLENLYTTEDVLNACRRLMSVVNQPVPFGSREINISASIGVSLASEGSTADIVLRNADVALHHAKSAGKGHVRLFDEEMYESAFERLELKADLQHALERDELILHYQPLISMETGKLTGFEALLRWVHPTRGFISPMSFIPLAEETGLIVPIGAWVLETATRQLARWRVEVPDSDFGISINVSPRQLEDDGVVEDVRRAIDLAEIEPSSVTLELTESSGLEDVMSRERLIKLRSLGCEIAADDFGTGFASYAALQQLPFTNVKIDRSLIIGLSTSDQRALAQVRSIIQMGHAIGLTITAEGIEDARQRDALAVLGADKGQGYLFGKPTTAKEATELVIRSTQERISSDG